MHDIFDKDKLALHVQTFTKYEQIGSHIFSRFSGYLFKHAILSNAKLHYCFLLFESRKSTDI